MISEAFLAISLRLIVWMVLRKVTSSTIFPLRGAEKLPSGMNTRWMRALCTAKKPDRASANYAKHTLWLCCIKPDYSGMIWYSLRMSHVILWVDIVGKNASRVSARRTVAIVFGPVNVPFTAALRGWMKSLNTFWAYNFMSSDGTCRKEVINWEQ